MKKNITYNTNTRLKRTDNEFVLNGVLARDGIVRAAAPKKVAALLHFYMSGKCGRRSCEPLAGCRLNHGVWPIPQLYWVANSAPSVKDEILFALGVFKG